MWANLAASSRLWMIQTGAVLMALGVMVYDNRLVAAGIPCERYNDGLNELVRVGLGLGNLAVGAVLLIVRLVVHLRRREPRRLLAALGIGAAQALLLAGAFELLTLPHILYCWRLDLGGKPLNPCAMGLCAH